MSAVASDECSSVGGVVEAVDRLAAEVIAHAAPMSVGVAASPSDLEAAFRMRYRCVVDEGWACPDDFPDGMERDVHDDEAIHIVAWDGGTLAGTVRLVTPASGRPLPIEDAYGLRIEPIGQVVDGGRLVVAPEYRGRAGHVVLAALFARFWQETRAQGYRTIAAVAPRGILELYRNLGLHVTVLGPPRDYWGDERYPLRLGATERTFAGVRTSGRVPAPA